MTSSSRSIAAQPVFPPGESPFHTKGNAYRALFESADLRVPGGSAAVMARIDDPLLQKFFTQQFLAASSYDILPMITFGMIGAKIAGVGYPEFVRGGAAFTARRDMRGIYKVILKFASPRSVVQRLPRILIQYFDFGRVDGTFTSDTSYAATAHGIPRPLIVWIMNVAHGFIPVVMEGAGARNVTIAIHQAEVDGETNGMPLVRSSFDVKWSE